MTMDPYEALGVKKTATDAEIKKAYRKIAKESHPDLNPDDKEAEARFKAASAAYDLLKDPEQRARFDRGEIDAQGQERPERHFYRDFAGAEGNPYQAGRGFEGFGGIDPEDLFADILRQRAQGGAHGFGGGFGDEYGRDFGGARTTFKARGPDMRYSMEVPFMDAVKGATTRITLPTGGTLDVKIPEGTKDGQTIRLRGKGGPGIGGGPAGDAYVTIGVKPHPLFRREEDDILITLPISIDEAVLGGKVEAPTIDGPVKVTIPKGASSGQVLRLRGRGVKNRRTGKRGDQKIELRIVMPPKIDEELESFMKEWRKKHAYNPRKGMKT